MLCLVKDRIFSRLPSFIDSVWRLAKVHIASAIVEVAMRTISTNDFILAKLGSFDWCVVFNKYPSLYHVSVFTLALDSVAITITSRNGSRTDGPS